MSLYGMMRTGVSGMNAQANRLSTVADNIANSSTTGYKRASTEFSSLIIPSTTGNYTSGGVTTTVRNSISQQGDMKYTTSGSDLAINGNGFFVVQGAGGSPVLTRAGSFVPNAQGQLVNAAGFQLMGYSYENGIPSAVANGLGGLVPVTINQTDLVAIPSTTGIFTANLPLDAEIVDPADLPSANAATAKYSAKSSLVTYNSLGSEVLLDVYYTKTADNTWEVAIYKQSDAAADTSFPYTGDELVGTQTLEFDPANGKLTTTPLDVTVTIPGPPTQDIKIDLSKMTQLDKSYTVVSAEADGAPPASIEGVQISDDGTVYAKYENGALKPIFRIPIATVQSPDMMQVLPGNVFSPTADSGVVQMGFANESGRGKVVSGALEGSNVDIAQELTDMIESQRSYTANSKVFQTGADLMDILVNLKR
ncbi:MULTISPECIES: flagellar hook protein FlgE [unclassified Mesorhizobium]|jgi:flagellar hook protein FlgE|uniref:flagellar hook protein FlgE n=1 Tax=unclassified Mesorhizobium TaxID=325217 RepID=UPI0008F3CAC9|nr:MULTISPECIES: flagellar hook protein FlgE [unclassified Mesorhizobium]RJG44081.1 flagellar hook protein FlgE [Mesorhizobium sp. DCY119]SFU06018.1 flagellar hook protein FlgE [Mesorhizobium sp. YR577]